MVAEQARYHSYLLRLWRVGSAEALSWRASLEDVRSRERRNFANLHLLFAFLIDETGEAPDSDAATPDSPL